MASSNANFKAGDDWRKSKELEEARKAGLAPAERDEDGNEINPHIPQYMASAPWYLNNNHPSLKHQRNWNAKEAGTKQWYERGAKVFQADKYRKGACPNCGSMTHKIKDCLERPRNKGAKWTGVDIAADDKIETLDLDFEGKRDRWNGYDSKEYSKVMDRYEKVENIKTELQKEKQLEKKFRQQQKGVKQTDDARDDDDDDDDEEDDEKMNEVDAKDFGSVAKRVRTAGGGASGTVRNLRIREDTAKYLLNLDITSAHYDPKTRSMREDPTPHMPASEKFFAGDNFVRHSGDTLDFYKLNTHAWEAYEKGQDIHLQAAPSQAQYLAASFKVKKTQLKDKTKTSIIDKYGDASNPDSKDVDQSLLLGQTESYVEYDRAGRVIKGDAPLMAKTKYPEDEFLNNHTAVWGSWWSNGVWGFACCRSHVKNSYCTGAAGIAAVEESGNLMSANIAQKEANKEEEDAKKSRLGIEPRKVQWGTEVPENLNLDKEKLAEAIKKEEERQANGEEVNERKRGYNVTYTSDVTEEEMEAYRLKKKRGEDPTTELGSGTSGYDLV
mmetsp:Transcript_727/g.1291  ORF Transcript_727/g.1291 Transcript_727/m.1291 type:complete len:554 (-) Transcript_727:263-1924(-)|eukprot:CAMPEP_0198212270 /NCGR_PEP_ID=MMETSP1445-20131203/25621_1 /TAXON_ID=36898 /ORGANISM="Pyramimonas sp., Strain CCMP2087" /LENGTH=553 /DNA_ID=CAMNT_0043886679 /DNA_START=154 /DNA_END=1815 /DNA_ORIENTATION=-